MTLRSGKHVLIAAPDWPDNRDLPEEFLALRRDWLQVALPASGHCDMPQMLLHLKTDHETSVAFHGTGGDGRIRVAGRTDAVPAE